MNKVLMKGNEAIAESAIRSGCKHFFGYPITPQNEVCAYFSKRMPKIGGIYLQAESEVAAINMVYGAAGAGVRAMTSSSSPGVALKSEGISYIAAADLPCVIVNIVRGGPGLGGIQPAQSDYFMATKGGGHGDFKMITLAPSSVQEAVDCTRAAFDLADKYRTPVMLLGDGILGQMMEPVSFFDEISALPKKSWATTGTKCERRKNVVNSLYIDPNDLENKVIERYKRYAQIEQNEVQYEADGIDGADIVITAYGTTARIAKAAIKTARAEGLKVGLIRPITLYPFPTQIISETAKKVKSIICVEMSMGQMIDDVKIAVNGVCPVSFCGRTGGIIPTPSEILDEIRRMIG